MPIIDLLVRADRIPSELPYRHRRKLVPAGAVATYRDDADHLGPLDGYGIWWLLSRRARIIRIPDAVEGDGAMLKTKDALQPGDPVEATPTRHIFPPRKRLWLINIPALPTHIRRLLMPRRLPDVDHPFFLNHPRVHERLIQRFPEIARLPAELRRSTPWDISLTREQLLPILVRRPDELRDAQGNPDEPAGDPDFHFDGDDEISRGE